MFFFLGLKTNSISNIFFTRRLITGGTAGEEELWFITCSTQAVSDLALFKACQALSTS